MLHISLIRESDLPTYSNPHIGVVNAARIVSVEPVPAKQSMLLVFEENKGLLVDNDWTWTRQPQAGDYFLYVLGKPSTVIREIHFRMGFTPVVLPARGTDPDPSLI